MMETGFLSKDPDDLELSASLSATAVSAFTCDSEQIEAVTEDVINCHV